MCYAWQLFMMSSHKKHSGDIGYINVENYLTFFFSELMVKLMGLWRSVKIFPWNIALSTLYLYLNLIFLKIETLKSSVWLAACKMIFQFDSDQLQWFEIHMRQFYLSRILKKNKVHILIYIATLFNKKR